MSDSDKKITVTVKVFGGLRELLGKAAVELALPLGADIERLLLSLAEGHPSLTSRLEEGLSRGYVNVLLNGRNIRFLNGLSTSLNDRDSVAFLPPVGGG